MAGKALRAHAEPTPAGGDAGLVVVKLGGSVIRSGELAAWLDAIAAAPCPIVVVPGGGALADEVRACQAALGFGDPTAHRMALLAMDQLAWAVAGLRQGFVVGTTEAELRAAIGGGHVAVWAPYGLIAGRSDVEESWRLTSDSLALWLAARIGASRCFLIKSVPAPGDKSGCRGACAKRHRRCRLSVDAEGCRRAGVPARPRRPEGLRRLARRRRPRGRRLGRRDRLSQPLQTSPLWGGRRAAARRVGGTALFPPHTLSFRSAQSAPRLSIAVLRRPRSGARRMQRNRHPSRLAPPCLRRSEAPASRRQVAPQDDGLHQGEGVNLPVALPIEGWDLQNYFSRRVHGHDAARRAG